MNSSTQTETKAAPVGSVVSYASLSCFFPPQIAAPWFPHLGKWASAVYMENGPSEITEEAAPACEIIPQIIKWNKIA